MEVRKHALPSLQIRAAPVLESVDREKRTIEVVWTTGSRGLRSTWVGDYYEELSLDPKHVDLKRLNGGAPVLDAHESRTLRNVIGVVEKAWIVGPTEARAILKLTEREDARGVVNDILNGIIRNVSVGYSVRKLVEVERIDDVPVLRAEDWEAFELSFVPIGFDPGAQSRAGEKDNTLCTFKLSERTLEMGEKKTEGAEQTRAPEEPKFDPKVQEAAIKAATERALGEERERIRAISEAVSKVGLERSIADQLIAEGKNVDQARAFIIDNLATRDAKTASNPVVITTGVSEAENIVRGIEEQILCRAAPQFNKPTELSARFRSASMLDMAREVLHLQGVRTHGWSKNEIAGRALTARGLHTTSDFPLILGNSVKKILKDNYQTAQADFGFLTRRIGMTDYKSVSRFGLSQGPSLLEVKEHGEYKRGSIAENAESMALKKYGRILGITREVIVNDDIGAFADVPRLWAFGVNQLEANLVFGALLSNPIMSDGLPLFEATVHKNIMAPSALTEASLEAAVTLMEAQTGFSAPGEDTQYLNVRAKYLLVGPALKFTAKRLTTAINPLDVGSINLFSDLEVKVDPRITGNKWFVTADTSAGIDIIGHLYMIGEEGPQLDERQGFDVDGVEFKVRIDTGAKALDWRGVVYNPGA